MKTGVHPLELSSWGGCRYFNEHGWPTSSVVPQAPTTQEEKDTLVDTLQVESPLPLPPTSVSPLTAPCPSRCLPVQEWKSSKYQDIIGSGTVPTRPGVLRLMDKARAAGLQVAVCSASTKSSCVFVLLSLLGQDRFDHLDCFLAGDDVDKKKPDPTIYKVAAQRLGKDPSECLVVEDSMIGLRAALGAGMRCCITTTGSTKAQSFEGAAAVFADMGMVELDQLRALMQ